MAKQVLIRRGTTAQHAAFAGALGEITLDTDSNALITHDGVTLGGFPGGGYLPAGTGAVATTVQAKSRERVSVFDFMTSAQIADVRSGAPVLDVTTAIQAAIDYASTGHYTLTVPSGIYLVSALTLKSNVSMVGELRQAAEAGISVVGSVFKQLGTTGDVFTTANFPTSTVGAVITDLIIRGNSSATSGRGVYISQGCTWCSVIRCCVYQFAEQGVILGGTANRAEDCFIGYNNLLGTTGLTFYVGSLEVYGTDQYVLRNQVHGRYDPSPLDGGALSNASGYNVSCLLQTVASFITNNVFEYGDNGAVFVAKHPSSTGGVGRADPYYPVSCQANVVTGNRADRNLGHGFPLVSTTINGPSKNTFTGNSALNNGRNANNTYSGFSELINGAFYPLRNTFTGNTVNLTDAATNLLQYGFNNLAAQGLQPVTNRSSWTGNRVDASAFVTSEFSGIGQEQNIIQFAKGIAFPATNVPSTDVNTLDDYQEGTFTPTLAFNTPGDLAVSYSVQTGTYTKVGNLVSFNIYVATSAFTHTTASSGFRVNGLPFTVTTATNELVALTVAMQGWTKATYTQIIGYLQNGSTGVFFRAAGSGVNLSDLVAADVPTGGASKLVNVSGQYRTLL